MKFKRLTHEKKLSGRLYDELERMILDGELKAGDRLPTEAVLCEELGVSRSSLREALQQLKGRGLIESTAGRGMFIRSIEPKMLEKELQLFAQVEEDPQAFFELVEFRLMIEPEMTRVATAKGSETFLEELEHLLLEMETNVNNLSAFMEADLDMHQRIAKEAGNRFVKMMLSCVKPLGKRFGRINYGDRGFVNETLEEHAAIVSAIRTGDSEKAAEAMRNHLLSSKQHFEDNIKTQ